MSTFVVLGHHIRLFGLGMTPSCFREGLICPFESDTCGLPSYRDVWTGWECHRSWTVIVPLVFVIFLLVPQALIEDIIRTQTTKLGLFEILVLLSILGVLPQFITVLLFLEPSGPFPAWHRAEETVVPLVLAHHLVFGIPAKVLIVIFSGDGWYPSNLSLFAPLLISLLLLFLLSLPGWIQLWNPIVLWDLAIALPVLTLLRLLCAQWLKDWALSASKGVVQRFTGSDHLKLWEAFVHSGKMSPDAVMRALALMSDARPWIKELNLSSSLPTETSTAVFRMFLHSLRPSLTTLNVSDCDENKDQPTMFWQAIESITFPRLQSLRIFTVHACQSSLQLVGLHSSSLTQLVLEFSGHEDVGQVCSLLSTCSGLTRLVLTVSGDFDTIRCELGQLANLTGLENLQLDCQIRGDFVEGVEMGWVEEVLCRCQKLKTLGIRTVDAWEDGSCLQWSVRSIVAGLDRASRALTEIDIDGWCFSKDLVEALTASLLRPTYLRLDVRPFRGTNLRPITLAIRDLCLSHAPTLQDLELSGPHQDYSCVALLPHLQELVVDPKYVRTREEMAHVRRPVRDMFEAVRGNRGVRVLELVGAADADWAAPLIEGIRLGEFRALRRLNILLVEHWGVREQRGLSLCDELVSAMKTHPWPLESLVLQLPESWTPPVRFWVSVCELLPAMTALQVFSICAQLEDEWESVEIESVLRLVGRCGPNLRILHLPIPWKFMDEVRAMMPQRRRQRVWERREKLVLWRRANAMLVQ
jgi:hypothetical protein